MILTSIIESLFSGFGKLFGFAFWDLRNECRFEMRLGLNIVADLDVDFNFNLDLCSDLYNFFDFQFLSMSISVLM